MLVAGRTVHLCWCISFPLVTMLSVLIAHTVSVHNRAYGLSCLLASSFRTTTEYASSKGLREVASPSPGVGLLIRAILGHNYLPSTCLTRNWSPRLCRNEKAGHTL